MAEDAQFDVCVADAAELDLAVFELWLAGLSGAVWRGAAFAVAAPLTRPRAVERAAEICAEQEKRKVGHLNEFGCALVRAAPPAPAS